MSDNATSAFRTFDSVTMGEVIGSSDVPVLVEFTAEWCPPCKMIAPFLEEIATEREGDLVVGHLDVDEHAATAAQHAVQSMPTMALFKDGKEVHRIIGARPKAAIIEAFEPYL
jgi:thioredoxin 1